MSEIVQTELGQIEFTRYGKGRSIVFLHGGHSNCNEALFHKGYDLSKYELITPSRPGYGRTPLNNYRQPKEAARLISALIFKLDLDNVIIVGISAGGLTAIELAKLLGQSVSTLILISAVTKKWLSSDDKLYKTGKRMFSPSKEKLSWKLFRIAFRLFPRKMTKILMAELSTEQDQKITQDEIAEIKDMTFKQSSGSGFDADLDQDVSNDVIAQIKCPTLILHSENDKSVNIEMAIHANEEIENSELITFNNKWGHLLWVGDECRKPIKDLNTFLDSTST